MDGDPQQITPEVIGNQGRYFLANFISERAEQEYGQHIPAEDLQEQGPFINQGPQIDLVRVRGIARAMKFTADELDGNPRIQTIINEHLPDASPATFYEAANVFFSEGPITWTKVVALFYFGYKLAARALDRVPIIRDIISWVTQFLVNRVAHWIIQRGGWASIIEYFGTPTWEAVAIFSAGVFTALAVVVCHNKGG